MELIDNSIQNLIQYVEYILTVDSDRVDTLLIDGYFKFRTKVKESVGTGSNLTGIAEFLYCIYIKRYLETQLNIQFNKVKEKKVYYFKAVFGNLNLLLCSDIDIYKYFGLKLSKSKNIHPDILIALEENDIIKPIAIIEIKIYQGPQKIRKGIVERFTEIKSYLNSIGKILPFFVFLFLHSKKTETYDKIMEDFKKISETSLCMRKVVTKWNENEGIFEGTYKGSINKILNEIIGRKLKKDSTGL